jgi:uncharacterized membrane protein YczE
MADPGKATSLPLRVQPARRLTQLAIGLAAYGASAAFLVQARLGNMPWDVFHQGLGNHLGLDFGTVSVLVSVPVLLLWIPLRQRPGIGTVSNAVLVGVTADLTLHVLPSPSSLALRIFFLAFGIVLCAVASGLYIGARLGPGPRDGLMTGLAARGLSIRLARTGIEVLVVVAGFLLGGTLGVGTLLYAVTIGPLVQVFLPWFTIRPAAPDFAPEPALDPGPHPLTAPSAAHPEPLAGPEAAPAT